MTLTRSGIPTSYRGTAFRSRLEARWAAFFDLIGWSWVYEPFDTPGWLPDFLVQGASPFLVEVGPCATDAEYQAKAATGPSARDEHATLILGVSPLPVRERYLSGRPFAGWLTNDGAMGFSDGGWARWSSCRVCGEVGVYSDEGFYGLMSCGHYDGDGHLGSIELRELEGGWAQAGNETQWRP